MCWQHLGASNIPVYLTLVVLLVAKVIEINVAKVSKNDLKNDYLAVS